MTFRLKSATGTAIIAVALHCGGTSAAANAYRPITPSAGAPPVVLTGHDLSIEEVIRVARQGAQVSVSAAALKREADNYGLLLEAAAEGMPVYWFNRGVGDQRETVLFEGDPTAPANRAQIERTQLNAFRGAGAAGIGPEIDSEDVVRAIMVVRANAMTFNAPSPALARMLVDLLNRRVTPVVQSRGTVGEGDLAQLGAVAETMVGVGEAYYQGVRMPAAQALERAGLLPLQPFAADDNALTSSNSYATAQAALLVADARAALEWADLIYAIDLNGMNSSVTPLSLVVQRDRPGRWLNWHARRTLDMIKGSYLFGDDPRRIIQDPESLRASSVRQAAAWEEWAALNEAVLFQLNSSDHNPAVAVGLGPDDAPELASPQLMHFFVRGGALSHGQHGYIVSNANWDPYPLANKIENFTTALANMCVAVASRIERFRNPFFTVVSATDFLKSVEPEEYSYAPVDLLQEIQGLAVPVAPSGVALLSTVEDLEAQTRLKAQRARRAVDVAVDLLGLDLIQGSLWMNVREAQDAHRTFGTAPTAAWQALRVRVPLRDPAAGPAVASESIAATEFIRTTPAATFFPLRLPEATTVH